MQVLKLGIGLEMHDSGQDQSSTGEEKLSTAVESRRLANKPHVARLTTCFRGVPNPLRREVFTFQHFESLKPHLVCHP